MAKINDEIILNLYAGTNPYITAQPKFIDNNYPHTNIKDNLINFLISTHEPQFWLELGAFVGGSALKVAKSIKSKNTNTGIICCDPFCGDVNMWDWEMDSKVLGSNGIPYKFLALENGLPTIYQRFLANVLFNGYSDLITPIQTTSIVGIKLIERLFTQNRISNLPDVIYLDSAHEVDETYLELVKAWNLLPKGGVLLGDDWGWESVRDDVIKFSKKISVDIDRTINANTNIAHSIISDNILLYEGQWIFFKS